jgi:hypothetical protein
MRYNAPLAARLPRTFRFCPCRFVVILSAAKNPTRDPHAPAHPTHHRPFSCTHCPQFTQLLIWPRVQKMKSFRKSRDTDGKFALTTPQNPLVNASPRELAAIAIKQLQESIAAAERKKQLASAAAPSSQSKPPVLFADEPTPTASPAPREEQQKEVQESAVPVEPISVTAAAPRPRAARRPTKRNSNPKRSPRRRTVASVLPLPDPSALDYHQRKCKICNHPQREEIEEDFINWCKADEIVDVYQLEGYRAVYRHAHATGLFERRRLNIRSGPGECFSFSLCDGTSVELPRPECAD